MAANEYDKGPIHGGAAQGYSAAYDADRARALQELTATQAGRDESPEARDPSLKNPDGEFQHPASMPQGFVARDPAGPGPNGPGNSKGDGTIDPQGQQGGTGGGEAPSPPLVPADRQPG